MRNACLNKGLENQDGQCQNSSAYQKEKRFSASFPEKKTRKQGRQNIFSRFFHAAATLTLYLSNLADEATMCDFSYSLRKETKKTHLCAIRRFACAGCVDRTEVKIGDPLVIQTCNKSPTIKGSMNFFCVGQFQGKNFCDPKIAGFLKMMLIPKTCFCRCLLS